MMRRTVMLGVALMLPLAARAQTPLYCNGAPCAPGTDASGSAPSIGNVLATFTVLTPGAYYVQNQSAAVLEVVFDNGTSGQSVQILSPGPGVGTQGGDTSPPMAWFTGRVRVVGPAGSQYMARSN